MPAPCVDEYGQCYVVGVDARGVVHVDARRRDLTLGSPNSGLPSVFGREGSLCGQRLALQVVELLGGDDAVLV